METQKNIGDVVFVGAGPGDPELLTLKGARCIREASLILYAGSLVPTAILPKDIRSIDTAPLTLDTIYGYMRDEAMQGGRIARVHTGDPSLYGALREESLLLTCAGIPWSVVPGVTAACAAAAAAGISFTVPTVTQTLIISRMSGRTPMPERENIASLAQHGSSLAIYLSGKQTKELEQALSAVLPKETPVLCAHKVGFPDEVLLWTTIEFLHTTVVGHSIERQTVLLVLPGESRPGVPSCLYEKSFVHGYRPVPGA